MMKNSWLLVGLLCISILSCKPEPKPEEKPVDVPPTTPVINFNVSGIIPHSTTYFTAVSYTHLTLPTSDLV